MSYFSVIQARQSSFYRRLWQELQGITIYDTHEHLYPEDYLWRTPQGTELERLPAWKVFDCAYIHGSWQSAGGYAEWANLINRQKGTGYLKSLLWAFEDLFDLEPPVTATYLEELENIINQAYTGDAPTNDRLYHVIKDHMHAETVIQNLSPIDQHLKLPQPTFQATAGLSSICNGVLVPNNTKNLDENVPYWFATQKMGKNLADIRTLDDYMDVIDHLIDFISSKKFLCANFQLAYERLFQFPEPDKDVSKIRVLFNKKNLTQEEQWKFGDYILYYFLERMTKKWNHPVQFHTGLGQMIAGGGNAINLNHLFRKFPDLKFDVLHGNYPWHMVLAGMMHQIPNIYADLSWLCITSPTATQQALVQLIEIGDMAGTQSGHEPSWRTAVFGGDCVMVEGSYGALLMTKDVVCRAMDELYDRGLVLERDAVEIAGRLLYDNPKRPFGSIPT
jgi:hypothetical protein